MDEKFTQIKNSNDLVRFEENNFDKIVLMRSGNFWAGYDNTVWFLEKLHHVTNKKRKIRYDRKFKRNIRLAAFHMDAFVPIKEKLLSRKLELIHDTEEIVAFALPEKVPPEQLRSWRCSEEDRIKNVESMLMPDRLVDREAIQRLVELGKHISDTIQHDMPKELRETMGRELLTWAARILSRYTELEIGRRTKEERREIATTLVKDVQSLSVLMMMAFNSGTVGSIRAMKVGQQLHEIAGIVHDKYIRIA
ncbi:hypothetical protein FWH13_02010 [Candidatus Saccharibacteria bacterium]|nr:hypothetical protein [Candidatus Saccharibacteria bacterium]